MSNYDCYLTREDLEYLPWAESVHFPQTGAWQRGRDDKVGCRSRAMPALLLTHVTKLNQHTAYFTPRPHITYMHILSSAFNIRFRQPTGLLGYSHSLLPCQGLPPTQRLASPP